MKGPEDDSPGLTCPITLSRSGMAPFSRIQVPLPGRLCEAVGPVRSCDPGNCGCDDCRCSNVVIITIVRLSTIDCECLRE